MSQIDHHANPSGTARAVIFDVDGVLVDSYHAHFESWRMLAAETGTSFDEADFEASFGRTSRDIVAMHWPSRFDAQELDERKESLYRGIVAARFPLMPGAGEVIRALHEAGFSLALASSGPPENIELALTHLGCRAQLGAVITGRDVTRGKPDPEVFLRAAEALGIRPLHCVVIEDAPAGIVAARRAGMAAIAMLSRGRNRPDFADCRPDLFVDKLSEVSPATVSGLLRAHHESHSSSRSGLGSL